VRLSLALYARLLRAYPASFREVFGQPLQSTLRDALRAAHASAGVWGVVALWPRTLLDLAQSAGRERLDAARQDGGDHFDDRTGSGPRGRRDAMGNLLQDLRYALRSLLRQPGFTVVAVLTLALGIGANTALFSVVRSVLLEPLPYRDPAQVAMIWSRWQGFDKTWVSEPEYLNYRKLLRSFEDIALFSTFDTNITENEAPVRLPAAQVTPNLFPLLGVTPVLGRGFRDEEAQGDAAPVLLVSWELWQSRYEGDASILGRKLSISGEPYEIIGVLPRGFGLPLDFKTDQPVQVWYPYAVPPMEALPQSGGSHGSYAIGRLRAGVTEAAANAELHTYVTKLRDDGVYPPEWNFEAFAVTASHEVAGTMRSALLVLLGAVGFVLLIACVNVANLLLVRAEDRRREISVRTAMGADGPRLVRQLLVENLVLALVGGTAGVWVAWLGMTLLRGLAPANLPRVPAATIDGGVLGFTLLLSLLTAGVFGLVPALQALRTDVQAVLKESGRSNTAGGARQRVRQMLVLTEVALAVVLAVGAGLMLRSFWRMLDIDPGFRAENVLTMRMTTPAAFYPDDPAVTGFYTTLLTRVRALPGVEAAGLVRVLPIDREIGDSCVQVEGYVPPPGQCTPADWQAASDGYFEALGMRLVEGRFIEATDTREATQVMVVNQAFVRQYFADGQALGKRVRFAFVPDAGPQIIVGVVGDARHNGITGQIKPTFYRPHAQWAVSTGGPQRSVTLVLHTRTDAAALTAPVRSVVRELDARLPVSNVQTMSDVLARAVAQPRFTLVLLLAFGLLALALAVVGIYGVVSYAVAARRDELGIRMALGAEPRAVVWLSLQQGLGHAVLGVLAGTVGALGVTRLLQNLVYDLPTTDPLTYLGVALFGLGAAFMASWIPARRAARTDPAIALRTR
jgi:predicted permease